MLGLRGKRALVLGGGYGIGQDSARLLARAGADVVVADRDPERAAASAAELTVHGGRTHALSGDVTDRAAAVGLVDRATAFLGGLDVMINMIGFAAWGTLLELDDDAWELDLSRNLRHHIWTGTAAARHMIAQGTGGALATVASVSGIYGAPHHGAYGAAKAGLDAYVRYLAEEAGDGLTAFSFVPGLTDTAMQAGLREVDEERFPMVGQFRRWHERGASKDPAVVAEALELALALPRDELHGGVVEADQLLKRR